VERTSSQVGLPPTEKHRLVTAHEEFMFMGKAGDIVLYKHHLTRRYLNIDAVTGKFYRYSNDDYVEIDRRHAFDSVYGQNR